MLISFKQTYKNDETNSFYTLIKNNIFKHCCCSFFAICMINSHKNYLIKNYFHYNLSVTLCNEKNIFKRKKLNTKIKDFFVRRTEQKCRTLAWNDYHDMVSQFRLV